MNKNSGASRVIARIVISSVLFITVWFYSGCEIPTHQMIQTEPPPISSWGDRFQYHYDHPGSKAPASVGATIVVVNPSYKENESALGRKDVAEETGIGRDRIKGDRVV